MISKSWGFLLALHIQEQDEGMHRKSFDGNKTKLNLSLSHCRKTHNLMVRRKGILKQRSNTAPTFHLLKGLQGVRI